jgi:superfamily I DNA/RNA helicase
MALPPLEGRQREVVCLPEKGHYIVLGTAGSGKTTMAIRRAAYLSNLNTEEDEKVLLVTFNKALVTYLQSVCEGVLKKVDVRNYHKFATGYLGYRGLIGWKDIVPTMDYNGSNEKLNYIKQAMVELIREIGKNSTLSRAPEVFQEEINWIQKMGITTVQEYMDAERIGRGGTRITKENREYFFIVYEKYKIIREQNRYKYDWDDIAYFVREELRKDDSKRMYKHIIIDEGQDLSPVMLQSLALAIPEDGSLTFFGDVAQQIYGSRISWRHAGLNIGKEHIWRFGQNYRNSKEIAELALAISELPYFKSSVDIVTPQFSTASAPKPALVEYQNEEKELNDIIGNAKTMGETHTVAILVRDRQRVRVICNKLYSRGIIYQELKRNMDKWKSSPGISVGTYHSAKGLEFDAVLLPYCNGDSLPEKEKITALESREEALSEEIKLIYVAVTRAKRTLVLTYTGELTELIPVKEGVYKKHQIV